MHRLLGALVLTLALPFAAGAQSAKRPVGSDTLLVRTLAAGILAVLNDDLVSEVVDGSATPWTVMVRDSTNGLWGQVQRGLRTLLRADADSAGRFRNVLEVGTVQVRGDTAVVEIDLLGRSISPSGCRTEGGMSYLVRSVRRSGAWTPATVRPYRDTLPAPCP